MAIPRSIFEHSFAVTRKKEKKATFLSTLQIQCCHVGGVSPHWTPPNLDCFERITASQSPASNTFRTPDSKKGARQKRVCWREVRHSGPPLSSPLHFLFLFPLPSFLNPKRPEDGEKQALGWPDAAPWKKHPRRSAFLHIRRRTSALFLRHLQFLLIGINSRHPNYLLFAKGCHRSLPLPDWPV